MGRDEPSFPRRGTQRVENRDESPFPRRGGGTVMNHPFKGGWGIVMSHPKGACPKGRGLH